MRVLPAIVLLILAAAGAHPALADEHTTTNDFRFRERLGPLAEHRGEGIERRFDLRGDRIDARLDRQGERLHARLARRAAWAEEAGHPQHAQRLLARGERLRDHFDRRGDRINARLDRRGEHLAERLQRREACDVRRDGVHGDRHLAWRQERGPERFESHRHQHRR